MPVINRHILSVISISCNVGIKMFLMQSKNKVFLREKNFFTCPIVANIFLLQKNYFSSYCTYCMKGLSSILDQAVLRTPPSRPAWITIPLGKKNTYSKLSGGKEETVVAHHLFLLCFPPRPSRDLLFPTHVVHM